MLPLKKKLCKHFRLQSLCGGAKGIRTLEINDSNIPRHHLYECSISVLYMHCEFLFLGIFKYGNFPSPTCSPRTPSQKVSPRTPFASCPALCGAEECTRRRSFSYLPSSMFPHRGLPLQWKFALAACNQDSGEEQKSIRYIRLIYALLYLLSVYHFTRNGVFVV